VEVAEEHDRHRNYIQTYKNKYHKDGTGGIFVVGWGLIERCGIIDGCGANRPLAGTCVGYSGWAVFPIAERTPL